METGMTINLNSFYIVTINTEEGVRDMLERGGKSVRIGDRVEMRLSLIMYVFGESLELTGESPIKPVLEFVGQ